MQNEMVGEMGPVVQVELPRGWYWKKLLDCQREFIRDFSTMLLRVGINDDAQFNRLLYLMDYAKITNLLDREEQHKASDLAGIWIFEFVRRCAVAYELLMAVPWKLLNYEREFSFN